jgi:hypothetical protein
VAPGAASMVPPEVTIASIAKPPAVMLSEPPAVIVVSPSVPPELIGRQ